MAPRISIPPLEVNPWEAVLTNIFYDPDGRLIQEMESLGQLDPKLSHHGTRLPGEHVKGSRAVVRQWQSKTNLWTDLAIQYIYQDGRGAIGLIEVQDTSGHITASRVSPYLQLQSFGPQGPGVVGATAERSLPVGYLPRCRLVLAVPAAHPIWTRTGIGNHLWRIVAMRRRRIPRPNVRAPKITGTNFQNPYGWSPVTGSSVTDFGGAGAGVAGVAWAARQDRCCYWPWALHPSRDHCLDGAKDRDEQEPLYPARPLARMSRRWPRPILISPRRSSLIFRTTIRIFCKS